MSPLPSDLAAKTPGSEIKAAREALGLSQAALAARLGLSKRTLEDWERGAQAPGYLRLALAYVAMELAAERGDVALAPAETRDLCRRVAALGLRYTAVIDGEPGAYGVVFPDLPGCAAMGDTIDEALENARTAIGEWMAVVTRGGGLPPKPRHMGDLMMAPEFEDARRAGAMFAPVVFEPV